MPYRHDSISHHDFFNGLSPTSPYTTKPEYGENQPEVIQALMEAWAWLQSAGLLVEKASSSPGRFFISRRGKQITSRDDFEAYRKANLLPKAQLHPLIARKVYPAFLRGEYDTAVFQALREVEVSVRQAGRFTAEWVGEKLMRAAFASAKSSSRGPCDRQPTSCRRAGSDVPSLCRRVRPLQKFHGARLRSNKTGGSRRSHNVRQPAPADRRSFEAITISSHEHRTDHPPKPPCFTFKAALSKPGR
jgi:hypothetical protein